MSGEFPITIYCNSDRGTSRNAMATLQAAGYAPIVIEYLKTGWERITVTPNQKLNWTKCNGRGAGRLGN